MTEYHFVGRGQYKIPRSVGKVQKPCNWYYSIATPSLALSLVHKCLETTTREITSLIHNSIDLSSLRVTPKTSNCPYRIEIAMCHALEGELGFLARDNIYDTIKPYSLRFEPPDASPRHNLHIEKHRVNINDARLIYPTIERNGFTLTSVPTTMSYKDFNDHSKIQDVYAPELQNHLKNMLQARHVRVIDYVVSSVLAMNLLD